MLRRVHESLKRLVIWLSEWKSKRIKWITKPTRLKLNLRTSLSLYRLGLNRVCRRWMSTNRQVLATLGGHIGGPLYTAERLALRALVWVSVPFKSVKPLSPTWLNLRVMKRTY